MSIKENNENNNKIDNYCNKVCEQVRWAKAHKPIYKEIESHIFDLKNKYTATGDSENTAIDKAILQMGDANHIGLEFDRTHKPEPQWIGLILCSVIIFIGALLKFLTFGFNFYLYFLPCVLATIILFACYFLDFTFLGKHSIKIIIATVIFTTLLLSTNIEKIHGGSYSFLFFNAIKRIPNTPYLLRFNLEIFAIIFPSIYAIYIYYIRGNGLKSMINSILFYLLLAGILYLISLPSAVVIFSIIAYCILLYSTYKGYIGVDRKKWCIFLISLPIIAILILCLLIFLGYTNYRTSGMFYMETDIAGNGFIYNLLRGTLSEMQLFGQGELKFLINDESWTEQMLFDFAPSAAGLLAQNYWLAYVSFCYGAIVFIIVAVLIFALSAYCIKKALNQNSVLGSLLALSISLTFLVQSVVYFIENLSYGVISSISLPLIDGSNYMLLVNAGLLGFMLSIFRTGDIYTDEENNKNLQKIIVN